MIRWLSRIPLLGEILEFIYGGVLLAVMVGVAAVWCWNVWLLLVAEAVLACLMLGGYFWIAKQIHRESR